MRLGNGLRVIGFTVFFSFSGFGALAQDQDSGPDSGLEQGTQKINQFAETLKNRISAELVKSEKRNLGRAIRDSVQSSGINLADIEAYIKAWGALSIPADGTRYQIEHLNLRLKRSFVYSITFVQSDDARLIEAVRTFAGIRNPTPESLLQLKADIPQSAKTPEGSVVLRVSEQEYSELYERLRTTGIKFELDSSFAKGTREILPRMDRPTSGREKWHQKWLLARSVLVPGVALGAGIAGGALDNNLLAGIVSGGVAAGLELQFSYFNTWWNDHVWSRYGFKALVAANILYPLTVKLSVVASEYFAGRAPDVDWEMFIASTAFGGAAFIASVGALQVANAELKARGVLGETQRFVRETLASLQGNAGRVVGLTLVSGSTAVATTFFDVFNPHFWAPATWIGLGIQATILSTQTLPAWATLWSEKDFDARTKALIMGSVKSSWSTRFYIRWKNKVSSCLHALEGKLKI